MKRNLYVFLLLLIYGLNAFGQLPDMHFVRQGVKRIVFDPEFTIPLSELDPKTIIGLQAMHPVDNHADLAPAKLDLRDNKLQVISSSKSETSVWLGGFNPFASYFLDLELVNGDTDVGIEFKSSEDKQQGIRLALSLDEGLIKDVFFVDLANPKKEISIAVMGDKKIPFSGKLIVQLLGSGVQLYQRAEAGLPEVIGQMEFDSPLEIREIRKMQSYQSWIYIRQNSPGRLNIQSAYSGITTGTGLADIRALSYEDGSPILEDGRLWYSMTMRGRGLAEHLQGIFSMNPTVFDLRFEGAIVFDRGDGLYRNEVASHLFYDRRDSVWRGITTGFSAFARPENEHKQLWAVESKIDPRFGFSVMKAWEMGQVGDIEDAHIFYDAKPGKWRILTCENTGEGYRAVLLESPYWDRGYHRIAGPVKHNSTGTSLQRLAGQMYAFSGSDEREIFIYSYPELKELGTLKMDLPPWDATSGTRVWPNIIQLPQKEGYPHQLVALMMDRYNYPGIKNVPHWTYGALYLYYGYYLPVEPAIDN